ncbi:MAG: aminopeptidase [Actinomycetota bacterium]
MNPESKALQTVLVDCLDVREGENVLVVTDPTRHAIARRLTKQARELGAETVVAEMSERAGNGSEPPDHIAAAMLACDVMVAPTAKSLSHTAARRAATDAGMRAATMPGITEEMLVRTMGADYGAIRRRSKSVADALSGGTEVHITNPEGTDVTFSIEGRSGLADDGDLRTRGSFGNLPAGEGFVAPVEGATNGRIVFDGAADGGELLVVTIENGRAIAFDGAAGERFRAVIEPHGPDAFSVAELGIGTNEAARLTGNVLEDEKVLGTIHVAFGDNHTFGGTVRVSSHMDRVVLRPSVLIDGSLLLENGRLLV